MKPSAFTSQVPPSSADTTSSRPGAGSEKSAGLGVLDPNCLAHGFEARLFHREG